MSDHTDAYKNFLANFAPIPALLGMIPADLKRSDAALRKAVSRHTKSLNVNGIISAKLKNDEWFNTWRKTKRLVYDWIPVMSVTFIEAFLEEGLSELARKNPALLWVDEVELDYSNTWEVDSLEELKAELRQQWAGQKIKGGRKKLVKFLQRIGGSHPPIFKDNCLFWMQHLWDVRNLIVHGQGRVSRPYAKKYPTPPLKPGARILFDARTLEVVSGCTRICREH
jgi:hypothetical protein